MRPTKQHAREIGAVAIVASVVSACAGMSSWDEFSASRDSSDPEIVGTRKAPRADAASAPTAPAPPTADAGATDEDDEGGAPPAVAPIEFVQHNVTALGAVESAVVVVPFSNQRAGSLMIVAIGWFNEEGAAIESVSDLSGPYQIAVPTRVFLGDDPVAQAIWFKPGVSALAANTVTVRFKMPVPAPDVRVFEYAGLDPVAPLDAVSSAASTGSAVTSGTATTRFRRELLFAAATTQGDFTSGGNAFTLRVITKETNLAQDRIVGAIGTYAADAPLNPAAPWVMQLATFH
jgi:hypothetical protein